MKEKRWTKQLHYAILVAHFVNKDNLSISQLNLSLSLRRTHTHSPLFDDVHCNELLNLFTANKMYCEKFASIAAGLLTRLCWCFFLPRFLLLSLLLSFLLSIHFFSLCLFYSWCCFAAVQKKCALFSSIVFCSSIKKKHNREDFCT